MSACWVLLQYGTPLFFPVLDWELTSIALAVKNHGIPDSLISTCIDSSKQFFDLPLPTKEAVSFIFGT